jgi:hypothetical protein
MTNAPTTDQSRQGVTSNEEKQNITKPSLRSAINAKSREYIYCSLTGTGSWRLQVENCTSISCPLYSVRTKPARYMAQRINALENPEIGHNAAVSDIEKVVG